jgi:hypothetical protein
LLYAVPVADIATRVSATELKNVPPAGWAQIGLSLAVITFAWIGHHKNRNLVASRQAAGAFPFCSPRFVQFIVEVLIIAAYFALGARLALRTGAFPNPSGIWQSLWLTIVFVLYLIWDILDFSIARSDTTWAARARKGSYVTVGFLIVFALLLAVVISANDHTSPWVVAVDAVAICLLYSYRVVQEQVQGG